MEDYKHAVRAVRKKLVVLFLCFHLTKSILGKDENMLGL